MIDYESLLDTLRNAGFEDDGVVLSIDTLPISASKGIFLRSSISGDRIDYELPRFCRGTFRLIARAATYQEGQKLLLDAISTLQINKKTKKIGDMNVRYCRAITSPISYPVSEGNLREFAVNMEICYDDLGESYPWEDEK